MTESYETLRAQALATLAEGDAQGAFAQFRWILEYPGKLDGNERWSDALEVFARIAEPIAGEELTAHIRRAAAEPDDAGALYELGYELMEQALHGIAATVLARARALAPDEAAIALELAGALESSDHNAEACRVLRESGDLVEESFVARFLLAFNALMTGDLEEPRALLPKLGALLAAEGEENDDYAYMHASIAGMLERADAIRAAAKLDAEDLRAWHFVLNGGVLLHVSPHGFHEGMRGRYAFTQDSEARCLEGIRRAAAVLGAWQIAPPRVFVLPDRDSAILAHATALVLGVPAAPWPRGGTDAPGLVVAYDLTGVDDEVLESLHTHRPGQLLFVHAACWTEEPPFVGDLTTYLYQTNEAPWATRLGFDPTQQKAIDIPADESPAEEIAARIASASLEEGALDDVPALVALAEAAAKGAGNAAPGAFLGEGERRRQRTDSPVKSNRFL